MEINTALRAHQRERSENLALLHTYLPPIIQRFYGGDLPLPALSFEYARPGNLGWYCEEDGLALCHRININRLYADGPLAEVLETLTHEVGHCWQHVSGKPSRPPYHNKQFQAKMLEIGIPCDTRGHSIGRQEPFIGFLHELGVEAEPFSFKQVIPVRAGTSRARLKPWSCGCTRIWASIRVEVTATCTKKGCGSPFQRQ